MPLGVLIWALITLMTLMLYIVLPLKKVKDSALHLASGHYEEGVDSEGGRIEGPKEIEELSYALQTLRECLIHKPTATPDKLYGEYECAELLQFEMLDTVIETITPPFEMKKVSLPSANPLGLRLLLGGDSFEFQEAEYPGFKGTYKLLTEGSAKRLKVDFLKGHSTGGSFPEPLLWSQRAQQLLPLAQLQPGDFLILTNRGCSEAFPHSQALKDWLTKILQNFADDDLSLTCAMLQSELNLIAKKQPEHKDIYIFLFKYRT